MFDHPWTRTVLGVLAAVVLGAVAARVVGAGASGGPAGAGHGSGATAHGGGGSGGATGRSHAEGANAGKGGEVRLSASGDGRVTVHVAGAVRRPGVYRLREGGRVEHAVRRAGGMTHRADRDALNLAAPLRDGQQVLVPTRPSGTARAAGDGGAGGADGPPVDLNSADAEELQQLDGVGPTTAAKIVKLRQERGGLAGVDDLDEIPGIGPKTIETLRGQLGG